MKLLLLFAALLVAAVTANSDCEWGVSYWCKSTENAVKCGKLEHCRTQVWKAKEDINDALLLHGAPLSSWKSTKNMYDVKDETVSDVDGSVSTDMKCRVCEYLAKDIIAAVNSAATKDEAKKAAEDVCNKLKPVSSECKSFVNGHFEAIWDYLTKSASTPAEFCSHIFSECATTTGPTTATLKRITLKGVRARRGIIKSLECKLCKEILPKLISKLEKEDISGKIMNYINPYCNSLPSNEQSECKAFIGAIVSVVVKDIINATTSNTDGLCKELGYCDKTVTVPKLSLHSITATTQRHRRSAQIDACALCKEVVGALNSSTTEAVAKAALEELCDAVPTPLNIACKLIISEFFDEIWQDILNDVDPNTICSKLGLCSSNTMKASLPAIPNLKGVQAAVQCDLCKLLVEAVEKYIQENATEAQIINGLEVVCKAIPIGSSECKDLVDKYAPRIIALLLNDEDPKKVCSQLGLCSNNTMKASLPTIPKLKTVQCDLCKIVVKYINQTLITNQTEDEVEKELELLCGNLGALKDECQLVVKDFFPRIWDMVVAKIDPETICTEIGLCSSSARMRKVSLFAVKQQKMMSKMSVKDSELCDLCKTVDGLLYEYAIKNGSKDEVKTAVDKICNLLQSSECTKFVDEDFGLVWDLIVPQMKNATHLCMEIDVCSATTTKRTSVRKLPFVKTTQPKSVEGSIECALCDVVIEEVEKLVNDNATVVRIEQALDELCSKFPSSISGECKSVVDTYLPLILKAITDGVPPKAVCTTIGLCSSSSLKLAVFDEETDCEACEIAFKEIKTLIPYASGLSTDVLEKLCDLFPSTVKDECADIVKKYGPQLIELLDKLIDPQTICKELKVCK